jgi:hypothetical protein
MDNGEVRFRLMHDAGDGYIRTMMGSQGGWQNAHSHDSVIETYIVQSGWIGVALMDHAVVDLQTREEGDSFTTVPGAPHNIYLPAGSVIHTVKHGACRPGDWHASPILDQKSKGHTEQDLLDLRSIDHG